MNFAGANRRGGIPLKYPLTEERAEILRREYDSKNRREFAVRWGVPAWVITRWAQSLGVSRTKEPPWTPDQVELLERRLSTWGWRRLAKATGRTVFAVKLKAKRLQLRKMHTEGMTAQMLALSFGVDSHVVLRWIRHGWLRARFRNTDRTPQQGGDAYYLTDRAIRQFIKSHPEEIDFRRVDKLWFIDLAFGTDSAGYGPASDPRAGRPRAQA